MALERKDLVQDTASSTGTGAFVMAGTPPAGFQAFSVHTNGATFDYKASAGAQWEVGVGTWNGTNIARSPTASSNANGLVNFTTAPTVMEVVSAASVATFLRAADGVDVSTVTPVGSLIAGDTVLLIRSGVLYTAAYTLFGTSSAAASAVTLAVSAASTAIGSPVTVTVSTNTPLTGTQSESVTLTAPVAGTWSVNPVTLNATTGTVSPTFTPSAAGSGNITASASGTPTLTGGSVAYAATAAASETLVIGTIATPQTVGTQFTVNGTWTGVQPTGIDYALTDNGGAQSAFITATNAANGLLVNANNTWSFNVNPSTSSTSRTMQVRDTGRTTVLSAASNTYVVNAAAVTPVTYQFNGKAFTEMPTTASFGGGDAANISADFIIKTAGGVAPVDANVDIYAAMATSSSVMPRPNDAAHTGAPAGGPAWRTCGRIGAGNAAYDGNYSYSSLYTYKSFGGGLSPRYTWIMVFQKGADPATATPIWAAPYDGNHTGTPIAITVTA